MATAGRTRRAPVIGPTIAESTTRVRSGAPPARRCAERVVIVLDDLGFAQLGCYGSDIATPAIDGLAAGGLRYRRFHVTAMCSPTRACLLTGRNQHRVGMGFVADLPIGFPGYDGRIPRTAAGMPRLLRDAGYSTFAVGKWHLAPRWEQSASGPFDHWPLGLGFERYYGFLNGDTNQWTPDLVSDNGFVDPPRPPEDGYHLTEDLADRAIRLIPDQQQATPGKPFFLYLATGAMHAPHQAPAEYIDAYRGQFDDGWEAWRERTFARQVAAGVVPEGTVLTERPPWVPDWAGLPPDERRLYARMMEVFAGFVTHTDAQIGRVLDFLRATGQLDDTLVLLISDNGTSARGRAHRLVQRAPLHPRPGRRRGRHPGPHRRPGRAPRLQPLPVGLGVGRQHAAAAVEALRLAGRGAHAADRPLAGGHRAAPPGRCATSSATPSTCCRPCSTRPGSTRRPWSTASTSCPSTAPACGRPSPTATRPAPALDPVLRDHRLAGRSCTTGGRRRPTTSATRSPSSASRCPAATTSTTTTGRCSTSTTTSPRPTTWRPSTPSGWPSCDDLWWHEAGRNQVLPLDDSLIGRAVAMEPPPVAARAPARVYRPGGGGIAEDFLPAMGGGFRLAAEVVVPDGGGEGVVCALGDWNNGWAGTCSTAGRWWRSACSAPVPGGCGTRRCAPARHTLEAALRAGGRRRGSADAVRRRRGRGRRHAARGPALPLADRRRRAADRPRRRLPGVRRLPPPFPFTGTIDHVAVESAGHAPPAGRADVAAARAALHARVSTTARTARRTMPPMPTDDRDDPGADTAMFRAYVEHPAEAAAPAQNRTLIIGLVVAIVVLAIVAIALVAS